MGAGAGFAEVVGEFGELEAVFAGAEFVEDHAEAVDVGEFGAGAFWGDEAFGADEGHLTGGGDEADVGEFGAAVEEDDVSGFDVAVGEAAFVEVGEAFGDLGADFDAFGDGEAVFEGFIGAEGAGFVVGGVGAGAAFAVVAEFHDVVVELLFVVAADVEDVDEAGVFSGDGFELHDAFEFAFEGAVEFEVFAADDFDGAEGAGDGAGEPDFAVAALADAAEDFVVGDVRGGGAWFHGD